MRIATITLHGKDYELTFSNRVQMRLENEKADLDTTQGSLMLLSFMMQAGDNLAILEGREKKGYLTLDELADQFAPEELAQAMLTAVQVMAGDRNVEAAEAPKNAESAPSAE